MIYQFIMILFLLIFYIAYFAKQFSLKKHGIHTNRLAKGTKPQKTQTIETFLLFTTYITAAVQFCSVFFFSYMGSFVTPIAVRIVGINVTFFGVIFFLLAITTMRRNWRAGIDKTQKTDIVSNGIYRYSRNPAFVGFDLLYIGTSMVFPNIPMLLCSLLAVTLLHLQILEEEKFLLVVFGEKYSEYKKKAARYLFF